MKLEQNFFLASLLLLALSGCSDPVSDNQDSTSGLSIEAQPQMQSAAQVDQAPVETTSETTRQTTSEMTETNNEADKIEELKETAREWTDKTGELAVQTWDVPKDKAAETRDASVELYESATTEVIEATDTVVEKSGEMYQATMEKSAELLVSASDELKK